MGIDKEVLHKLVDDLPEEEVSIAERFLRFLKDLGSDPVLRALKNAPEDDEPETSEEAEMVKEARDAYNRGEVLTDEQIDKELGS